MPSVAEKTTLPKIHISIKPIVVYLRPLLIDVKQTNHSYLPVQSNEWEASRSHWWLHTIAFNNMDATKRAHNLIFVSFFSLLLFLFKQRIVKCKYEDFCGVADLIHHLKYSCFGRENVQIETNSCVRNMQAEPETQ